MLIDTPHGPAPVEAAEVLARIQLSRGDRAAATKAIDFGLRFPKYQDLNRAYLERLLRNRLAVDPDEAYPEAKKLYEQAEQLRRGGKAADAGRRFTSLCARYPLSTWNDAAGYRIGQCLETLGRTAQAEQHWTTFVTGSPTGPWRGQARVGLVHLALVARGDLKTASHTSGATGLRRRRARCANSSISGPALDSPRRRDATWPNWNNRYGVPRVPPPRKARGGGRRVEQGHARRTSAPRHERRGDRPD